MPCTVRLFQNWQLILCYTSFHLGFFWITFVVQYLTLNFIIELSNYYLLLVLASCQDTSLDLGEKVFESEFNKKYGSKAEEAAASAALAENEKQVWFKFKIFHTVGCGCAKDIDVTIWLIG